VVEISVGGGEKGVFGRFVTFRDISLKSRQKAVWEGVFFAFSRFF
jgi:hypothetical protein